MERTESSQELVQKAAPLDSLLLPPPSSLRRREREAKRLTILASFEISLLPPPSFLNLSFRLIFVATDTLTFFSEVFSVRKLKLVKIYFYLALLLLMHDGRSL